MVKKSNKPYRIPYQGSKQALVSKIYKAINDDIGNTDCLFADNKITKVYDLFCGGGSVGYYFSQQGYDVVMNDIQKPLIDLHKKLQEGIDDELLYKWISREEFFENNKRQDWYGALIRTCWSFGNIGCSYLFGKHIEDYKKQLHFVVVNKCYDSGKRFLEMIGKQDDWDNFNKIYDIQERKKRRFFIRNYILKNTQNKPFGKHNDSYLYCDKNDYETIKDLSIVEEARWLNENKRKLIGLQHIESLQQLQQLQQLERLEQKKTTFACKNYWEFNFEPNSIIYCDPPYIGTSAYGKQVFDFDKFDNWVNEMKTKGIRVYISEYTNHNDEWREVASFDKMSLMNNSQAVKTIKQEKVFCNI